MLWSEPKAGRGVVWDIAGFGSDGVEGALFGITFEGFAEDDTLLVFRDATNAYLTVIH